MQEAVVLPFVLPFASSIIFLIGNRHIPRLFADIIASLTAGAVTIIDCYLLVKSYPSNIVYWFGGWKPHDGFPVGIMFNADPFGITCALLAAFICFVCFFYSWKYFDTIGLLYHSLMCIFLAGIQGFCMSGDIFNLFVFLEILSVASFALTGYKIRETGPIQGSVNFAVVNTVGTVFILIGIALLYAKTSMLSMSFIGKALASSDPDGLIIVSLVLLVSGFLIKSAAVPFHFWLSDAYAVAPAPVAMLFSGIMLELGILAIVRLFIYIYSPISALVEPFRILLLAFGLATASVGALMSIFQRHFKRLLAYMTVCHAGVMLIGVSAMSPGSFSGLLSYLLADGCLKAALFAISGILLHYTGTADILDGKGKAKDLWILKWTSVLAVFGLASLPPFGTAVGKIELEQVLSEQGMIWVSIIIHLSTALAAAAVLRAVASYFYDYCAEMPEIFIVHDESKEWEAEIQGAQRKLPEIIKLPPVVLTLMCFAAGFIPFFINDPPEKNTFIFPDEKLLSEYPSLVSPEKYLEFSSWITGLLTMLFFYMLSSNSGVAAGLRKFLREKTSVPIRTIRELHSGAYGDYVAWIVTGSAITALVISAGVLVK